MSIEAVRAYFAELGWEGDILEFDSSSATVELAAQAVGTTASRIAKTLSFQGADETAILIVCAGDTKIDNAKFKAAFGRKAKMLTPDDVLAYTNHAVGGVCPFALPPNGKVAVYTDVSLQRFPTVFPAAGSSNSAIELTCEELFSYSHSLDWVDVCKIVQ